MEMPPRTVATGVCAVLHAAQNAACNQHCNGTNSFYLHDSRGALRNLVISAGTITDTYIYTAFGVELQTSGSTINPFRYVGQYGYYREFVDIYYIRARWLDAVKGRWLSRDVPQLVTKGGRYGYVGQDLLSYVDPRGWQTQPILQPQPEPPPYQWPLRIVRGGLGQAPEAGFGPWFGFITKSCLTIGLLTQAIPAGLRPHPEDGCKHRPEFAGMKSAGSVTTRKG